MSLEIVSTGQWTATSIDQLLIEGAPHGAKVTVIHQSEKAETNWLE